MDDQQLSYKAIVCIYLHILVVLLDLVGQMQQSYRYAKYLLKNKHILP